MDLYVNRPQKLHLLETSRDKKYISAIYIIFRRKSHKNWWCKITLCFLSWWRHQVEKNPRYWPFVRGIHRSPGNSPHKGQWREALMFSLICAWINGWVNNGAAGDLRCDRAHHDVTVMLFSRIRPSSRYDPDSIWKFHGGAILTFNNTFILLWPYQRNTLKWKWMPRFVPV